MEQPILPLRDAPVLADAAAVWFSRRWGIPAESYRESMEQCLRRKAPVPQWYVVRDGGRLLAGAGVIANDFHDRISAPCLWSPPGGAAGPPGACWTSSGGTWAPWGSPGSTW